MGVTFTSGSNEFDVAYYNTEVEDATDAETDNVILAYRNNLSERTTLYAKLCSADMGANGQAGACGGVQTIMKLIMVLEYSTSSKLVS